MTTTIQKQQQANGGPAVTFGNVVDNIFQNSLRRFFDDNVRETDLFQSHAVPVNMREVDHQYELDVIAPGLRKEEFTIDVNDNILTIALGRDEKEKQTERKENVNERTVWEWKEYVQRPFSRRFKIDDTVDLNKISATYSDGILRIVLPKNERAKKYSLNIEVK